MTKKETIRRLATGVPGFDEVLGGGLPELSFNLIAGLPGAGKTTLAHQMMFSLASPERRAIYFTVTGEPPSKMLRYQQQFGFFDARALNQSIQFINLSDEALAGDLQEVTRRIAEEVAFHGPALIFVDSFRSVVQANQLKDGSPQALQRFVQQLGVLMSTLKLTSFLIGEYSDFQDANPVVTMVDGLIWMRQAVQRDSMVRKMEIVKMRGQSSLPGLHSFRIGPAGIQVFPPARSFDLAPKPASLPDEPRLLMGVPVLDEMLGGGLPRGYSLLISGPSGSGKTILSSSFLAEGARRGEAGILAVFEQSPDRSRNPLLSDLVERGCVSVVDTRHPDLSVDEIVLLLVHEIRRTNATRVVIDSLSGCELSLAPTFRDNFRESLLRMMNALAATGVSVVLTCELEDRYLDFRFSPYGTAFLTDAIIVQRYIEVDSRLRRMIAVVKLRGSAHSDELREFTIDGSGLQIGTRLTNQEGLLGGRPTLKELAHPDRDEPLDKLN